MAPWPVDFRLGGAAVGGGGGGGRLSEEGMGGIAGGPGGVGGTGRDGRFSDCEFGDVASPTYDVRLS